MKLRKRELVLLIAAPALLLGAIGSIGGMQAAAKANEVAAAVKASQKPPLTRLYLKTPSLKPERLQRTQKQSIPRLTALNVK